VQDFRLRLRLLSPLGTPWQSDTVCGHLAWRVAQGAGGLSVEEFLASFREGRPPFLLSDGCPGDLLPRPFLPPPPEEAGDREARARARCHFVSPEEFTALRRATTVTWQSAPDPWRFVQTPHAALSRATETTGTVGEGDDSGRFFLTDLSTLVEGDTLALYLRAEGDWAAWVADLLEATAPLGFGRDRSTGAGAYQVLGLEPWAGFAPFPEADGFVSLSSYCPAREDPTRGRWRLRLKYGKLGENAGDGNPFKRPLLQLEPGALFYTGAAPRPWYGRAVSDLAPGFPEALQCCYTLAVPCRCPQELREEPVP